MSLASRSGVPLNPGGRSLARDVRGASAVEHVVLLALIALCAIGAWSALGDRVGERVRCVAVALVSGGSSCGADIDGGSQAPARAVAFSDGRDDVAASVDRDGRARTTSDTTSTARTSDSWTSVDPSSLVDLASASGGWIEDHILAPIASVAGEVWRTPQIEFARGAATGLYEGAYDLVTGTAHAALGANRWLWESGFHPSDSRADKLARMRQTLTGIGAGLWGAATHPSDTWHATTRFASAMWGSGRDYASSSWDTLAHGSPRDKGHLFGRAGFEIAATVVPVSKIGKVADLGRVIGSRGGSIDDAARLAEGAEALTIRALVAPRAPLALEAARNGSVAELVGSEGEMLLTRGGALDPDLVLGVVSGAWARPWSGARRSSDELSRTLGRSEMPPPEVVEKAAARLRVSAMDLDRYLRAHPWSISENATRHFMSAEEKAEYLARWNARPADFEYLVPENVDFAEAVRAARIERDMGALQLHSRGVMDVAAFDRTFDRTGGLAGLDGQRGYLLGPAVRRSELGLARRKLPATYSRFAFTYNLRGFNNGYAHTMPPHEFRMPGGGVRPLPDQYMDLITSTDEPVVFLLPEGRMGPNTRAEYDWLLGHPHRMKNVIFVVGAWE